MDPDRRQHLLAGQRAGMMYAMASPRGLPMGLGGMHLADRPGSSLEFMDHRTYHPGDDLRRIDWYAYARSDRLSVKVYRREVNPHADILIDGSRSMALEGTAKAAAALGLSALLATAAENARFTRRVWIGGDRWRPVTNGAAAASAWEVPALDYAGSPAEACERVPPRLAPRGSRVLVADLLWPGEPRRLLARLADGAAAVVVVQVLARADVEPPRRGNLRLLDVETDEPQEVFVDAGAVRGYRDRLSAHQEHWHRAAREVGAVFTTLVAENLVRDWDVEPLVRAGLLEVGRR